MKKVFSAILAVSFLAVGSIAYAQSATDLNGIKISGTGFITFLGDSQQILTLVPKNGGTSGETEGVSHDQVEYRVELFFDKAFSDGSSARIRFRGGSQDTGLSLGSFRGSVNDAGANFGDGIIIKEAFYTKPFNGLPFVGNSSIVVGKQGAPTSSNSGAAGIGSFFTDDATAQGAAGVDNNPYGIKIIINPVSLVSITYAYLTQNQASNNNITEDAYNFIEANFNPIARGNYRIGYWYSAFRYPKNAWVARAPEDVDKSMEGTPLEYVHDNSETDFPNGILVSIDQVVVDNVTVFGRYGKRLDETKNGGGGATWDNSIFSGPGKAGQDFQIGAKVGGAFWGRAKDYFFLGYGMAWYQDKEISEDNSVITGSKLEGTKLVYETAELKPETHIELNYNYNINEAVNIIAFGQYVLDYAIKDKSNEYWKVDESGYALGLRIAINF
jgi:hypothetical protein